MTRVFLVRHGETEWNRQQIFRGMSDVPLNENGKRQAEALGRRLAAIPIGSIYASKLGRALETAKAIAGGQRKESFVIPDDGFTDINYGEWAGLSYDEARIKFPEAYAKWQREPQGMHFPGGESLQSVQLRAWRSFDRIFHATGNGEDIAIVSHQVVIRALLCGLFNLDLSHFWQFDPQPASVTEIRRDHEWRVLYSLNEVAHLQRAADAPQEPASGLG